MSVQSIGRLPSSQGGLLETLRKRRVGYWSSFALLVLLSVLWIIPILWAIDTALKPEGETTAVPVSWLASHFTLGAFISSLTGSSMLRWYFNSTLTSLAISILTVLLASLAAFAISRIPFRGKNVLFWVIIAGIMVPGQILVIPLFTEMQAFHMVDTYWGIILPQIAAPVAVFIFKQFFDGIPHELEDAAIIDGASRLRVYWQIWMPLARPAIAAVGIFTFVISWNNFIWPFIVITGNDMMTLPVGLATVQTSFGIRYAQIMATAILAGIPVLIVFLVLQRQIVEGIAGTGLKG
ncbi:MAG TPA: carbohydrate ABC transporter permease [Ktedonosporobacter sp.]|nr:carbohydrate ABC transporter permease [Ktedonosporobacter sp.]